MVAAHGWQQPFPSRRLAGRKLAARLVALWRERPIVVAVARGGVPIGFEIARALGAPLDILVTRKLLHPREPEIAFGAVTEGERSWIDEETAHALRLAPRVVARVGRAVMRQVRERAARFRGGAPRRDVKGRTVVVVDDCVMTGLTASLAARSLREEGATHVVLACPVCAVGRAHELSTAYDDVVILEMPPQVFAVRDWYRDAAVPSPEEVAHLVHEAAEEDAMRRDVEVVVDLNVMLRAQLVSPAGARGAVLLPHAAITPDDEPPVDPAFARVLHDAPLATLAFDLVRSEDPRERRDASDVANLGMRIAGAAEWWRTREELPPAPIGCYAAGRAALGALWAASEGELRVDALVVALDGATLGRAHLDRLRPRTLFVLGEDDGGAAASVQRALSQIARPSRVVLLAGSVAELQHDPALVGRVAALVREWLLG